MAWPYAYKSLPTGHLIRPLGILSTNAEGQLKVSLTTASLSNSALSFNALSYTWSDPFDKEHPYYTASDNKKSNVSCEDSITKVTESSMDTLPSVAVPF
jgi:hypothetical protein